MTINADLGLSLSTESRLHALRRIAPSPPLQSLLRPYSLQAKVQEVLTLKSHISHDLLPSLSKMKIKIV